MSQYVLDASALLAVFLDEQGADRVQAVMNDAEISSVNLAEIGARLSDRGYDLDELYSDLKDLQLPVAGFDEIQAESCARLRAATKAHGLSLGDRACLALAQMRKKKVFTADRAWGELNLDIEIELIR